MNLDDFIKNTEPKKKKSIFDEHIKDIKKLLDLGYTQKQVIEYLQQKIKNKVGLSEQNLSNYLKKNKETNKKNIKTEVECIRRNHSDSQPIYIRTLCRS